MKNRNKIRLIAALCALPFFARAANTWDGEVDGNWANPTNWDDNVVPSSGASLTFPDAANQEINLGANRTVANLMFNSSNTYRLFNNQLTLNNGNIYQQGSGSVIIDSPVSLLPNSSTRYVLGSGTGTVFLNKTISGNAVLSVSCTNAMAVLGGSNTYSANTILMAGTLWVTGMNSSAGEFRIQTNVASKVLIHGSDSVYPLGSGQWVPADTNFTLVVASGSTRRIDNSWNGNFPASTALTIEGPENLILGGPYSITYNVGYSRVLTVANPRTIVLGPCTTQVPGPSASFYKKGNGVLEFQNTNNTADIPFYILEGTLTVNGIFQYSTKSFTVSSGATLSGTGILHRTVTIDNGGTLAPAENGAGTLTLSNLTFQSGAIYEWDLDAGSDRVDVLKTLNFQTNATLRLRPGAKARCKPSDQFVLFTYTGANPTNPVWSFDFEDGGWTHTNAVVTVDTNNQRVVLSGIGIASGYGTVMMIR